MKIATFSKNPAKFPKTQISSDTSSSASENLGRLRESALQPRRAEEQSASLSRCCAAVVRAMREVVGRAGVVKAVGNARGGG